MNVITMLEQAANEALEQLFKHTNYIRPQFQKTRKEFTGDYTLAVFPYSKQLRQTPEETAEQIAQLLKNNCSIINSYNIVKGFLNIEIADHYWLKNTPLNLPFLALPPTNKTIVVEYSSPNTNKPLHLGHIRNNLLGFSMANILKAAGNKVITVNLVNDRGIHICKSMLAWKKFGNGETPQTSGIKGDHLVGKYYVEFDKHYKAQVEELVKTGLSKEEAEKQAPLMLEAQEMLRKWEEGDQEILQLWNMLNSWVYDGFAVTYKRLGVNFDKTYYESNTYLLGKEIIKKGLEQNLFYKAPDGSVRINLTADNLDEKVLLRSDGTSVYITQDLGTAVERANEWNPDQMIYVVGNEQDYHFKVLKLILKKLNYPWADGIYHLSYGMVELPHGKMKSREGTVVDADDLMDEMINTAEEITKQLGKIDELTDNEAKLLFEQIGLGALKYFILKVDPRKKMLFNPAESIDFNGHTGPFIQYSYARIQSLLRKAGKPLFNSQDVNQITITPKEKELLVLISEYPQHIQEAAQQFNPAHLANYLYQLAKEYNQFYHDHPILREENHLIQQFRLALSQQVGYFIKHGMNLLGIQVPDRM
jgi:arginyl-tRNA synthetase